MSGADPPSPDVCIIGCGRAWREDDQVGLRVAGRLADAPPRGARVHLAEADWLDCLVDRSFGLLVLIDAARPAAEVAAGHVARIVQRGADGAGGARVKPVDDAWSTTHTPGVAATLELAEALGLLPAEVWIYAVVGRRFGYGGALSRAVQAACAGLPRRIRAEIAAWRKAGCVHA